MTIKLIDGVAYTTDTDVFVSNRWIHDEINGEAVGSLVHEAVHVVQQFKSGDAPGWLVEGTADYVRWFKYEPQSHGADLRYMRHARKNFRYDGSYRITANFLNWVTEKYDKDIVTQLNAAMRAGKYDESLWKLYTGKTVRHLERNGKKTSKCSLSLARQHSQRGAVNVIIWQIQLCPTASRLA